MSACVNVSPSDRIKHKGNMHVIRPKSAKGRTRPRVTEACTTNDELLHEKHPFPPHPPVHPRPPPTPSHRFNSSPTPQTLFTHNNPSAAAEKALNIAALSLNKYKVLPSIEKRSDEEASSADTEKKSSRSKLHAHNVFQSDQEMGKASRATVSTTSGYPEGETGVLLAVRTPSGQRLMCQFRTTDTLWDVIATAENISGQRYEHALIETMEVPLRSFTDLNMTLSQCGIVNKSVLCISLEHGPQHFKTSGEY